MTNIYEVLRRPLVTEKTSYQTGKLNQYTFEVAEDATKTMVKDAVEQLLDKKVVSVNIINTAAKRGRRAKSRRLMVRKAGYKKAVITLAPGETLEMFEGVK
jgi:large subunit ribosomal protein L23